MYIPSTLVASHSPLLALQTPTRLRPPAKREWNLLVDESYTHYLSRSVHNPFVVLDDHHLPSLGLLFLLPNPTVLFALDNELPQASNTEPNTHNGRRSLARRRRGRKHTSKHRSKGHSVERTPLPPARCAATLTPPGRYRSRNRGRLKDDQNESTKSPTPLIRFLPFTLPIPPSPAMLRALL